MSIPLRDYIQYQSAQETVSDLGPANITRLPNQIYAGMQYPQGNPWPVRGDPWNFFDRGAPRHQKQRSEGVRMTLRPWKVRAQIIEFAYGGTIQASPQAASKDRRYLPDGSGTVRYPRGSHGTYMKPQTIRGNHWPHFYREYPPS